jgi:hypothetical protein
MGEIFENLFLTAKLIVQINFGNIWVGFDEIKFFCHNELPNIFIEMVIKDTKYAET